MSDSSDIEECWNSLKACILESFDASCGWTKAQQTRKETWWWNDDVDLAVKEKRNLWKLWKKGGSKEPYIAAKRRAKCAVYTAKKTASEDSFNNLHEKDKLNHVFKLARKLRSENQDITGDKCIRNDQGNIAYEDAAKLETWKQHYEKLLNAEFTWDESSLPTVDPILGPAIHITDEMVDASIKHLKSGKAAGPSGIVAEMLKTASDTVVPKLSKLINLIIQNSKIPEEWNQSFIINLYKGKGDAMECGNYRGLKLLEVLQKVLERILEVLIRSQISIDNMQFGFMPGRGTTDAIFILRQLQEKYIGKRKDLFFAFVDLEKAFDRIPRKVLWWSMRKLGIDEWVINTVQAMYQFPRSRVRINGKYSEEFSVKVGVHQGSVLSPLLFIIVMEALSRELRTGCPWELLYADDLAIIADTPEELLQKLTAWKHAIEAKGLRVNTKKTKVVHCKYGSHERQTSGRNPCSICFKGVGANSIYCTQCQHWVHKRCSGIKGRLVEDETFVCPACSNPRMPTPAVNIVVDGDSLESVSTFCYLGDTVGDNGGCMDAITARMKSAWKKFRELLPILSNKSISLKSRGKVFVAGVRGVLLHASETWAVTTDDTKRLERTDNAMVRWICSTKITDRTPMSELRLRLGIPSLVDILRRGRLRWFGHVKRLEESQWQKRMLSYEVDGKYIGRPKKRWRDNINADMKALHVTEDLAHDRAAWKAAITQTTIRRRPTPVTGKRRR